MNNHQKRKQYQMKLMRKKKINKKKENMFLNLNGELKFLNEYKLDKSQATCMACNSQYNVHYVGKSNVVEHSKNKQYVKNMLTFSVDRQLITTTIKPSHEKDEVAAAEATLVYHDVRHRMPYLARQCSTDILKTLFASSSIVKSLSCAKTKAAAIEVQVLAPYFAHIILK